MTTKKTQQNIQGCFLPFLASDSFHFSPVNHNYTLCIIHNVILHIYRYIEQETLQQLVYQVL